MKKARILYIDSDEIQRKAVTNELRSKGYNISAAASGETGIRMFNAKTFDVILCNYRLAKTDGLRILEKIRLDNPEIPFVLLSEKRSVSLAVKAIKKGAHHFASKPIDSNQIAITIEQIIEKSKLEKKRQESQANLQNVLQN